MANKTKHLAADFLKATASTISGAAAEYISEAMPTVSDTAKGAVEASKELGTYMRATTQSISPMLKSLKTQFSFKNVSNWFKNKESEFDDDENLSFDIDLPGAEIAVDQISETKEMGNKISRSVTESAARLHESQIASTANIVSAINKQSTVIASGFDRTHSILNDILQTVTKNTATIIELQQATGISLNKLTVDNKVNAKDQTDSMVISGKFNFNTYMKQIQENFNNSAAGIAVSVAKSMIPMMQMGVGNTSITDLLKSGAKAGIKFGINKKLPNLKDNLKVLDEAISNTVMTALIRLGEKGNNGWGIGNQIAKIFGIDASLKHADTSRAELTLGATPFDTITKEAITNTIPAYLQKILAAVSGEDLVYDYKSRTFKTKGAVHKEFKQSIASRNTLQGSSNKVYRSFSDDDFTNGLYDMMMGDLGKKASNGSHRQIISGFKDINQAREYVLHQLLGGYNLTKNQTLAAKQFARSLVQASSGMGGIDIANQVSKNNLERNQRAQSAVENAAAYNLDVSGIVDSIENDIKLAAERIGLKLKDDNTSTAKSKSSVAQLSGVNYSNMALYQIFKRLDTGINVFQVGKANVQDTPFKSWKRVLKAPISYQPPQPPQDKIIMYTGGGRGIGSKSEFMESAMRGDGSDNLLRNQQLEDGTMENLTTGQRIGRWGKARGSSLAQAIFSGNSKDVQAAFGNIIHDVTDVGGEALKKSAKKINESFGNVSGYLKHKMFGTAYSYKTTDENGKEVEKVVKQNEKGGIFGFVKDRIMSGVSKAKDAGSKWLKSITSMFNFGEDKDEKGDQKTKSSRKKFLSTAIGAFAGAGILGGPIGLLVGTVAGNALSALDIGGKIKSLFFGRDDKGKAKGIFTRLGDAIVDPIKFQVGKTVHNLGEKLKKNIFGPLSNLGHAIKDRITSSAESTFGKLFKGVVKLLSAPFKGLIKLAKAPITLLGAGARKATDVGTGVVGGGINMLASLIAGNSTHKDENGNVVKTRQWLRDQNKQRKADWKEGKKNNKWSNYKSWKAATNAERAERYKRLGEYTSEELMSDEEASKYIAERNQKLLEEQQKVTENTAATAESTQILADLGSSTGSLFVHDQGLHDRLDTIITLMGGDPSVHRRVDSKKISQDAAVVKATSGSNPDTPATSKINPPTQPSVNIDETINNENGTDNVEAKSSIGSRFLGFFKDKFGGSKRKVQNIAMAGDKEAKEKETENNQAFAGSFITGAATVISSDSITDEESRQASGILAEAGKKNPNKPTLIQKFKNLFNTQRKNNDKSNEKKESLFGKIFDLAKSGLGAITSKLGMIGTAVTGFLGISELTSLWNNVIKGDMNFGEWWGEQSTIGKAFQGLMDISKFIGSVGGPIVNTVSRGIETLSKNIPFMPTISPPQINTSGPFAGLATGMLGGLYLKGISAIGSVASAVANMISGGSNLLRNIPGLNTGGGGRGVFSKLLKVLGYGAGTAALVNVMANGGTIDHENTDANGNEIIDTDKTRTSYGILHGAALDATQALAKRAPDAIARTTVNALEDAGIKATTNAAGQTVFRQQGKFVTNATVEAATGMSKQKVTQVLQDAASRSAAAADDVASSKGMMGFIKKCLNGVKNFLMKNKIFNKFATTISSNIDKLLTSIGKNADKVLAKMPGKIAAIITKGGTKEAASIATAGIGYAVMAFGGALSGGLSAANIFGVRETDVNATMRTVASVIVALLNAVPGLWALELIDLIIAPMTFRRWLCQLLYGLLGGSEDLANKQAIFAGDLEEYNSTFGTSLTTEEYNDAVNKDMWAKIFGFGAVQTDENGKAKTDEAGEFLRTNHGIAGFFAGSGEKVYLKDANGNVLRDKDNKGIQAMDAYGHKIVKEKVVGNYIGDWLHDVGGFFAGQDEYEVDENGYAKLDANGNPIVKKKGRNIFQRIGDFFTGYKEPTEAEKRQMADNNKATITKMLQEYEKSPYELGEDGKPILDASGNPVKKGGLAGALYNTLGTVRSLFGDVTEGVASAISKDVNQEYETDANGNPLKDAEGNFIKKNKLADYVSGEMNSITSSLVNPLQTMRDSVTKWENTNAPWKKAGKTAETYFSSIIGNFWGTVTGDLDSMNNAANGAVGNALKTAMQILANAGTGGTGGGIGGGDDEFTSSSASSSAYTSSGGNPLNKTAMIASDMGSYGQHPGYPLHNGWHYGIDLVPSDGTGQADVLANFNGTVTSVKTNVPNSLNAVGGTYKGTSGDGNTTGNHVYYKTDDGRIVKNMHLAAGSIPTNIKVGARVTPGMKLGNMGTTGWSTGNHLHYQIDKNGIPTDPTSYVGLGTAGVQSIIGSITNYPENVSSYTSSTSESGASGPIGELLNILKDTGTNILNRLTGGLFGNNSTGESDASKESTSSISTIISNIQNGFSYVSTSGTLKTVSGENVQRLAEALDPKLGVELLTNSDASKLFSAGDEGLIIDVNSGYSFNVKIGEGPGNTFLKVGTISQADTDEKILANKWSFGRSTSWDAMPAILQIKDHQLAIGMNAYCYGGNAIAGTNPGMIDMNSYTNQPEFVTVWPVFFTDSSYDKEFYTYTKTGVSSEIYGPQKLFQEEKINLRKYEPKMHQAANEAYSQVQSLLNILAGDKNAYLANHSTGLMADEASIFSYLRQKGLTNYQAASLMANMKSESGYNPKYVGSTKINSDAYFSAAERFDESSNSLFSTKDGIPFGILGWRSESSKKGLLKYASDHGKSVSALQTQLDYIADGLTNSDVSSEFKSLQQKYKDAGENVDLATGAYLSAFANDVDLTYRKGNSNIPEETYRHNLAWEIFNKYKNSTLSDYQELKAANGGYLVKLNNGNEAVIVPNGKGRFIPSEPEFTNGSDATIDNPVSSSGSVHGWGISSQQNKLRKSAYEKKRIGKKRLSLKDGNVWKLYDAAAIDDRPLIATHPWIGGLLHTNTGDLLDVHFEDGDVWQTMKGDAKSEDSGSGNVYNASADGGTDEWGHGSNNEANNGHSVIEMIHWGRGKDALLDKSFSDYSDSSINVPNFYKKKISYIEKVGSYDYNGAGNTMGSNNPIDGATGGGDEYDDFTSTINTPDHISTSTTGIGGGDDDANNVNINIAPAALPNNQTAIQNMVKKLRSSNGSNNYHYSSKSMSSNFNKLNSSDGDISVMNTNNLVNIKPVLDLLNGIITCLNDISDNTGESTGLLAALNNKDFVDKGLRDSLNSLKAGTSGRSRSSSPLPATGAKNIAAIARPR